MDADNKVLKAAEKLYHAQKEKFGRRDKGDLTKELLSKMGPEELCISLEKEGEVLWRYADEKVPFTREEWREQLEKIWRYKKTFPVLYHVSAVYDKREVAACVLMTAGMSVSETDAYLELCSSENPSYYTRPLYPLHYKEGFFRLYFSWCEKHGVRASFRESIRLYEKYEKEVYHALLERLHANELRVEGIGQEELSKDILYYFDLCEGLGASMRLWKLPLSLERQDELQRMLVLLSHLERALSERRDISSQEDVLKANCRTRRRKDRGTKLCSRLIENLAEKSGIEEAIHEFVRQGTIPMGEACWRAISFIMREYGRSGGSGYENTDLFGSRMPSDRNKKRKVNKDFSLFLNESGGVDEILSFSLNIGRVKDLVRFETTNTTLIAELMMPEARRGENVFSGSGGSVSQTALSLFLREYLLWCEGKAGSREFGGIRYKLPFSGWGREEMIHFALACGAKTENALASYLELIGYQAFRPVSERECVVEAAVKEYRTLKKLPICSILEMQSYFPYFAAKDALNEMGDLFNEKIAVKWHRFSEKFRWYEMVLPGAPDKDKFQIAKIRFGLAMLLAALLKYGQYYGMPNEELLWMEQELLAWISGQNDVVSDRRHQELEMMEQITFSEYVQNVEDFGEFYIDELADIIFEEKPESGHILDEKGRKLVKKIADILEWSLREAAVFPFIKYRNAACLRSLYDEWFLVLGAVKRIVGEARADDLDKLYLTSVKFLEEQCIGWMFWGGTANFSLKYYKKRFRINRFSVKRSAGERIVGDKWFNTIQKLECNLIAWETICENVQVIKNCYSCIAKTDEVQRENQKFMGKTEECKRVLEDIIEYLENGMTTEKGLKYRYQKILEGL